MSASVGGPGGSEYEVIREIGKGAFGTVTLCKRDDREAETVSYYVSPATGGQKPAAAGGRRRERALGIYSPAAILRCALAPVAGR